MSYALLHAHYIIDASLRTCLRLWDALRTNTSVLGLELVLVGFQVLFLVLGFGSQVFGLGLGWRYSPLP